MLPYYLTEQLHLLRTGISLDIMISDKGSLSKDAMDHKYVLWKF